jgi:spore germination cell wall hydrolase CwlJ-like protein
MTIQDQFMLALTIWRENRGGGQEGMQSVANVILNRAHKNNSTPYEVCTKYRQFSSITQPLDPQLGKYPLSDDPEWETALHLAFLANNGSLGDITNGAINYYAPAGVSEPPYWAASMTRTVTIQGQIFFK